MTPDLIPPCPAGPQHPYSDLKKGMVVVKEEGERVVFGCMACLEVNHTVQVVCRTLSPGWKHAAYTNQQRQRDEGQQFLKLPRTKSGRLIRSREDPHAP